MPMATKILENIKVPFLSKASLSAFTTFSLGGPCRGIFFCRHPDELKMVIDFLSQEKEDYILIGGGSNLLVSDKGIDCYVVRYVSDLPLIERHIDTLTVSGSTYLDDVVRFACTHGLEGINYCSGIPGTVGGAIVGNAGAWGKQIGDVLTSVTLLSRDGELRDVLPGDLEFTYRNSILKQSGDIVVHATIRVHETDPRILKEERQNILEQRKSKHPNLDAEPCAGSFFRNIEPTSKAEKRQAAGFFLDQAGGKDLKVGGAYVYPKHANIIVKGEKATAQDVYELSKAMKKAVKENFDLDLVREVLLVGKFSGKPRHTPVIW